MNNTIGIIGGGFVGSATAWAFRPTHEVKVYDKDPKASTHTFEETVDSDFVFIYRYRMHNHNKTKSKEYSETKI